MSSRSTATDQVADVPAQRDVIGLPASEPELYVSRTEMARLMGLSVATIDRLVAAGMPSETWGRRTRRFRPSVALAWARSREYAADPIHSAPATAVTARGHGPGRTDSMSSTQATRTPQP